VSRLHGYGWTLSSRSPPVYPFGSWFAAPPEWTLSGLSVTPEEADRLIDRQGARYGPPLTFTTTLRSGLIIDGLSVTPEEAERIRDGEDPRDVLLNPRPYRLVVVPWTPEEEN
jgi:hypothetical protein